ncbi:MAG: thioesterase [Rhizobium sp.]|nr:MAG: thioesterase [Rhizobium sp.]
MTSPIAKPLVQPADNHDRAVLCELLASQTFDVPLTTNPALIALNTRLLAGETGDITLGFYAGHETTQGNGVVSGGTLAAMLDNAIALSVLSGLSPGQTCATISLTINMMRSARVGALSARARIDRLGRRVGFASAELFDAAGQCIASATSSLAVITLDARE